MKVSWSNVFVLVAAVGLTASLVQRDVERIVVTHTDTIEVAPAAWVAERDSLLLEAAKGLQRAPRVIVRTDTLVQAPDTIVEIFLVDETGSATISTLVQADSLYAPEIHKGVFVGDCDDGFGWQAGTVVCDKARFGHLYGGVELGAVIQSLSSLSFAPNIGIYWEPSYRSPWRASLILTSDGVLSVAVKKGYQLW